MSKEDRMQRRAEKVAEEHTRVTGTPVTATVLASEDGRQTTAYAVQHTNGHKFLLCNVLHPAVQESDPVQRAIQRANKRAW